jgi:type I restriction enzyme S subunit
MFGSPDLPRMKIIDVCSAISDGDWIESKDQSDSGIRLIQTGNVGNGEYLNKSERARYISEEAFDRLRCTEIYQGDVLISRLPDPIGRACELPELGERMITAVDCTIIRLNERRMNNAYFVAYTRTAEYAVKVAECSRGATRQRISRKDLESIELPVPDLEAQTRFATFAEAADKSKFVAWEATKTTEKAVKIIINSLNKRVNDSD